MALKLTTVAAVAHGATAFVPSSNIRAVSTSQLSDAAVTSPTLASDAVEGSSPGATTTIGVSAAAIAIVGAASSRSRRKASSKCLAPGLTETVGVCAPIYTKFDPLDLGNTDAKMERYTAVEIKHGRIAMIAFLGYVMPNYFHFPGCEDFGNGLSALSTIPAEGVFQIVAFIGAHEILVKPREGGMGAYDFGLGTELIEGVPAAEINRKQNAERNNGRLAMIAMMGLMVQDGLFNSYVISYMKREGWWGESIDFLVKDIPACNYGCAIAPDRKRSGITAMRAVVYEDPWEYKPSGEVEMSPSCPYLKFPKQLKGWVGGEKGFDPINATGALPVYLVREAELKHARVCMLATVGWITTDMGVRFQGEVFQNATAINAHDVMLEAGYLQQMLGFVTVLEFYGAYLLLNGMAHHMNAVNFQGTGGFPRDAGDFFAGKQFLPKEEAKANDMKLKELENGRLAMLAFSGIVTQSVGFGKGFPYI